MKRLLEAIRQFVVYFLWYRGNKVAYLRSLGVRIGRGCRILNSRECFASEPWLIEIGDHVTISSGVLLVTHDGGTWLFRETSSGFNTRFGNVFGRVRVLSNSFIGANAIVLPGVSIGPNSMVGAGSVVTRNVEPGTVVVGNPARRLCSLAEYEGRCRAKMLQLDATDLTSLRRELTRELWGEER